MSAFVVVGCFVVFAETKERKKQTQNRCSCEPDSPAPVPPSPEPETVPSPASVPAPQGPCRPVNCEAELSPDGPCVCEADGIGTQLVTVTVRVLPLCGGSPYVDPVLPLLRSPMQVSARRTSLHLCDQRQLAARICPHHNLCWQQQHRHQWWRWLDCGRGCRGAALHPWRTRGGVSVVAPLASRHGTRAPRRGLGTRATRITVGCRLCAGAASRTSVRRSTSIDAVWRGSYGSHRNVRRSTAAVRSSG